MQLFATAVDKSVQSLALVEFLEVGDTLEGIADDGRGGCGISGHVRLAGVCQDDLRLVASFAGFVECIFGFFDGEVYICVEVL